MPGAQKNKIVIVDENALFSKTVGLILSTKLNSEARSVKSAKDLFELLKTYSPDVIIYDLFLTENFSGTIKKIQTQRPKAKVIVLSFDTGDEIAKFCFEQGAKGFLGKANTEIREIVDYVSKVIAGKAETLIPQKI